MSQKEQRWNKSKGAVCFLLSVMVSLFLVVLLASCKPDTDPDTDPDMTPKPTTIQEYMDKNYKAEPLKNLAGLTFLGNGEYVLTYRIGKIKQGLLGIVSPIVNSKGCTISISEDKLYQTTQTDGYSNRLGGAIRVGMEIGAGVDIGIQAKATFEIEVSYEHEWTHETSITEGWTKGYNITYDLSNFPEGKYAIALFVDASVYQQFKYNTKTGRAVPTDNNSLFVLTSSDRPYYDVFEITEDDYLSDDYEPELKSRVDKLSAFDFNPSELFGKGSGTPSSPYQIGGIAQMTAIALMPDKSYILMKDIDYNGQAFETAIIDIDFRGVFDGADHGIKNFNIVRSGKAIDKDIYLGLFARNSGTLKNAHFVGCTINVGSQHSGDGNIYAGIASGTNQGEISNVTVESADIDVMRSRSAIGGIVGASNGGLISNCKIMNINIGRNGDTGGFVGRLLEGAKIEECTIKGGTITHYSTEQSRSAGGIIGWCYKSEIYHCFIDGVYFMLTSLEKSPSVGVIVGSLDNGTLTRCGISDKAITSWASYVNSFSNPYYLLIGDDIFKVSDGAVGKKYGKCSIS
ncbi:MAG: hypothetical protein LBT55_00155 [Clostridiaceae bacterium]|jgi:hypothetical protein|nr:hypothetical protein [Clostridiaceae bacterium]